METIVSVNIMHNSESVIILKSNIYIYHDTIFFLLVLYHEM